MKIVEIIDKTQIPKLTDATVVGIDIGSRTGKAVLLNGDAIYTAITATGVYMQETANLLLQKLFRSSGLNLEKIDFVVGTGYGRIALEFPDTPIQIITEISCHAMGAHFLNSGTKTIIDIGGQDSKVIKVDPDTGKVVEFLMNDKCAAGTGRFLEKVALLLGYELNEIGNAVLKSSKDLAISSQCVVFAESEIISLKANGERREDIAAAVHFASARRVRSLLNRLDLEPELVFSGGVSNNVGMKHALETLIGHPFKETKLDMIYAGSLGAAILAQKYQADNKF